eukprot:365733-Chlamydomonas_euryale.AAC.2
MTALCCSALVPKHMWQMKGVEAALLLFSVNGLSNKVKHQPHLLQLESGTSRVQSDFSPASVGLSLTGQLKCSHPGIFCAGEYNVTGMDGP